MIQVKPEMSQRDNELTPLELLNRADDKANALARKYAMLATMTDFQEIYALIDGAIFKLEALREKVQSQSNLGDGEIVEGEPDIKEEVDDTPLSASDMGKLVWGFLTSDEE